MFMKTLIALAFGIAYALSAQESNPTQRTETVAVSQEGSTPIYRVNVVARTTQAVNYGHRTNSTKIGMNGTVLLRDAKGEARIKPNQGAVEIEAKLENLPPPHRFGGQYLTYVLWAITPEGRATNLGEVLPDDDNDAKLNTSTELQAFALIVTAEPYFAVTQPSDVVVMENVVRPDTMGQIQTVSARYELLKRSEYTMDLGRVEDRAKLNTGQKIPMKHYDSLVALYQARNAVAIARASMAAEHASESLSKAEERLRMAELAYSQDPESARVVTAAREAAQMAEDARLIALRKQEALEKLQASSNSN
jgi:hypothetical protein